MAHNDSIVRGLPPQVLSLTCSDEMKVKVAKLIKVWDEAGKGKLAPSKALKKLNYAKEHGCPLQDDCTKCANLHNCPVIENAKEED